MADKTINDLTAATSLAAGDLLEIENTGNNSRKITAANAGKRFRVPELTILTRTTNQSVNSSSTTAASWSSAVQDDVSAWSAGSPTVVTVPSGYTKVRITGFTTWDANSTGGRYNVITKNGTNIFATLRQALSESGDSFVTPWLTVAASDTLVLNLFQTSGSARNFNGGSGTFGNSLIQFEWLP